MIFITKGRPACPEGVCLGQDENKASPGPLQWVCDCGDGRAAKLQEQLLPQQGALPQQERPSANCQSGPQAPGTKTHRRPQWQPWFLQIQSQQVLSTPEGLAVGGPRLSPKAPLLDRGGGGEEGGMAAAGLAGQ